MTERAFVRGVAADGSPLCILVSGDRITGLGGDLPVPPHAEVTDLGGRLVLPGFVDSHIHLDKSFIGERWHPHQPVGSLRERLAVEKRELAAAAPIAERAEALLRRASDFGTVAMRSHVDVDATTGLSHLHAVMQIREKWQDRVRIELVAFPQAGVVSCPGTAEILDAAVAEGADVIGGIDPETLDGDAEAQLDIVFGIAGRRGVRIDIHLHEPGQTGIDQLNRIAARTRAGGLQGRVLVSHAYALGEVGQGELEQTALTLADTGVAIMTNGPGARRFPPLRVLRDAGVQVVAGNDNIRDAWWPFGNGDMLQRAMLIAYRSGFNTDELLNFALHMASEAGARLMGLENYGLRVGAEASFVVLDAPNAAAAVAGAPGYRWLVRKGIPDESLPSASLPRGR